MKISHLACRFFRIEPKLTTDVISLLLKSKKDQPLEFDTYQVPDQEELPLSIVIKDRKSNSFGHEVTFWVDQVMRLPDREESEQVVRYYKEYKLQIFEKKQNFKNHVIIFGPKHVDRSLMNAIRNYVRKSEEERVPDPFILVKVDFGAVKKLMKEFPNLQHFCIRDIPDERTKGVIVRGNMLEETDLYDKYVIDDDTKGPVNFLGITTDFGKLIYLGKDGSLYSRMSFAKEDTIKIIYNLYSKLKKIGALSKRLEEF